MIPVICASPSCTSAPAPDTCQPDESEGCNHGFRASASRTGFVKKSDVSAEGYRWLTVVAPDDLDETELLLEPNDNPVVQAYQKGIFEQDIPPPRPSASRTPVQSMNGSKHRA